MRSLWSVVLLCSFACQQSVHGQSVALLRQQLQSVEELADPAFEEYSKRVKILDTLEFDPVTFQFKPAAIRSIATKIRNLQKPSVDIGLETFYASGQTASFFGEGLFTNLRLGGATQVLGVPIRLEGDLVLQNSTINRRLSALSFSFDHQALLEQYRDKIWQREILKRFEGLSTTKEQFLRSKFLNEAFQRVAGSEDLARWRDSLRTRIAEKTQALADAARDSVEQRLQQYEQRARDSLRIYQQKARDSLQVYRQRGQDSLQRYRQKAQDSLEIRAGQYRARMEDSLDVRTERYRSTATGRVSRWRDSLELDSLQQKLHRLEAFYAKADSLAKRTAAQAAEIEATVKEWQEKAALLQTGLDDESYASDAEAMARRYLPEGRYKKWLSSLRSLQLGSFRLSDSPLSAQSLPLNGFSVEMKRNNWYYSAGYGREGRQPRNMPDYVRNIRLLGRGRRVAHLKAGLGVPEKSHVHLSFTDIRLPGSDTLQQTSLPQHNVVLSLDTRYMPTKSFFIDVIAALSGVDATGKAPASELLNEQYKASGSGRSNLALLTRCGWRAPKNRAELSVGYQMTGSRFSTLGNLFLLKNRQALRLEGRYRFLRDRGQAKCTFIRGRPTASDDLYPEVRQNQVSGELSYRLGRRGSRVWANYSPNLFLQNGAGAASAAVYQLNLAGCGLQWMHAPGKRHQQSSLIQLTNYADQSSFGDTSTVSGLWYGMFGHTISATRYTFSALFNAGVDAQNPGLVRDFTGELSQTFTLKNSRITQGTQLTKRFYDSGLYAGGSGGWQVTTPKGLTLGINATYLFGLRPSDRDQFFIASSAGFRF